VDSVAHPAGVSSGTFVNITVDDNTRYTAGEKVIAFDPDDGAIIPLTINSKAGSTVIQVYNLTQNISNNTRIGADPNPACVAGDGYLVTVLGDLSGHLQEGYYASYRLAPLSNITLRNIQADNSRGYITPWPLAFSEDNPARRATEPRGILKGVFCLEDEDAVDDQKLAYGDEIYRVRKIDASQFPLSDTAKYRLVLGPMT